MSLNIEEQEILLRKITNRVICNVRYGGEYTENGYDMTKFVTYETTEDIISVLYKKIIELVYYYIDESYNFEEDDYIIKGTKDFKKHWKYHCIYIYNLVGERHRELEQEVKRSIMSKIDELQNLNKEDLLKTILDLKK